MALMMRYSMLQKCINSLDIKSCNTQIDLIVFITRCWSTHSLDNKYVWIIRGPIVITVAVTTVLFQSLIDKPYLPYLYNNELCDKHKNPISIEMLIIYFFLFFSQINFLFFLNIIRVLFTKLTAVHMSDPHRYR